MDGAVDRGSNAFDADVGVMVTHSAFKVGWQCGTCSSRRSSWPTEAAPSRSSVVSGPACRGGSSEYLRLAADSDLTTAETGTTRWRDAAVGAETHVPGGGPVLRGGIHWNTAGGSLGSAPVGSVGASYPSLPVDPGGRTGSFGSRNGDRGWGVGVRVLF